MSYTKHNYQTGDVLNATDLNEMDDQIAANEEAAATIAENLGYDGEMPGYILKTIIPVKVVKKQICHYLLDSSTQTWSNPYLFGNNYNFSCEFYDVEPGKTYIVSGASHSGNPSEYPAFILYNTNGRMISSAGTDAGTSYENYALTVPNDACHLCINKALVTAKFTIICKERIQASGYEIIDDNTQAIFDIDTRVNNVERIAGPSGSVPGPLIPLTSSGRGIWNINTNQATGLDSANPYVYAFFAVVPNTYYFVTCDCSGDPNNRPGGAFYDSNDTIISTFCNKTDVDKMDNTLICTPEGCTKMLLNRAYKTKPLTCRMAVSPIDISVYSSLYNLNVAEQLITANNRNPVQFSALDKGYVTFVWDDLWTDLDAVASLFASYGYPICVSAIPDNIFRRCDGLSATRGDYTVGMNMLDVVNQIVADGGEVMAHNLKVIGMDKDRFDYDFMYDYYVDRKRELEAYGFKIRGLMGSGGTTHDGSSQARGTHEQDLWLMGNYEYGTGGSLSQFGTITARTTINVPVSDTKAAILDAYTNHSWVRFACHSYTYDGGGTAFVETDLIEVLDYCQTLGIPIVTYAYMFDHFASTALEERIKALESLS